MRKHVRAVLNDLKLNDMNKRTFLDSGRLAPKLSSPAGSSGRGQVAGAARDELVSQHGEGDRLLSVGIDSVISSGDDIKGR